jgi:hypothetical protein
MKNHNQELYKLLKEGYEGSGGFLTGDRLLKYHREDVAKYEQRKKLAYYLNYLKPCVDAHVSPIFKSLAVREYTGVGANVWGEFLQDVDFTGTKISEFMKQAALASKLYGTVFIVMDRAAESVDQLSLQDLAMDRNRLPYAFLVEPLRVVEVEVDKFGRITKFIYTEPDLKAESNQAKRTLTAEGWTLEDSEGKTSGTWDLGMVPVIALPSKSINAFDPLPISDFASIAKTNLVIYNQSSWLSDILVGQTFSVLTYPSTVMDELTIGTNNALAFPPESSHRPEFIAPDASPAATLSDTVVRLQQECYRMAGVVNVTGVRSQQSGVAKAWDFEQTNQMLSDFADRIEAVEYRLSRLFQRWIGVEFEYKLNYPSDFSVADIEMELANAEIAKNLDFGEGFSLEVFKRVLTSYLPELQDEDFDRLVAEYSQMLETLKLDGEQHPDGE